MPRLSISNNVALTANLKSALSQKFVGKDLGLMIWLWYRIFVQNFPKTSLGMFKLDNEPFQQHDWLFTSLLERKGKLTKLAIKIQALFVPLPELIGTLLEVSICIVLQPSYHGSRIVQFISGGCGFEAIKNMGIIYQSKQGDRKR